MQDAASVTVEGLGKTYPGAPGRAAALRDVSFALEPGTFLAVVGASGCGKSTLLRVLAGLEPAFDGRVAVGGAPVAGPSTDRGYVFQEHRLFPWLTVEENVAFGLAALPPPARRRAVEEHLALVGLSECARAWPHQLSGGMSQRVAIARALAPRPRVLLMDEPFGALDACTRMQLQDELLRIWSAERPTVVFVTHDVEEAVYLADRVAVLAGPPGTVRVVADVPLPRPRDRLSPDFTRLRNAVFRELFPREEPSLEYAL